jgi:hypothetical protein
MVARLFPGTAKEDISDGLVLFDQDTNTITLDICAGEHYAMYAALHECICCGHYGDLAPQTDDPNERCGLIDKMLVEIMPGPKRRAYIEKRIEMFETLIERGLNPPMEPMFKKSIEILKAIR